MTKILIGFPFGESLAGTSWYVFEMSMMMVSNKATNSESHLDGPPTWANQIAICQQLDYI